jgi:cell wall-associated NlpC family hydrolase
MSSMRAIEISGRSGKQPRRIAGARTCALVSALAFALVLAALLGPAGAAATPTSNDSHAAKSAATEHSSDVSPFATLIAALGAKRAERAVDAIGHGLALIEARQQVAATERKLARQEAAAAAAEPEAEPVEEEEVQNPAEMEPASAGTNGTTVPHSGGGKLFAHTRTDADGSTAILLSGIALAPPEAPEAVQKVINAANTIVGRPYVWGGGHASFYSYGYDCSGSVSFALFGGGLIPEPLTSGSLEGWGEPGPGKWITVYANADHTFMEIAGLRWDTVGDARGTGPRWHLEPTDTAGFVVRHPPGL